MRPIERLEEAFGEMIRLVAREIFRTEFAAHLRSSDDNLRNRVTSLEQQVAALRKRLKGDQSQNPSSFLDAFALESRLGISRMTLWRWEKEGKFPSPLYMGNKRVWRLEEILAWEASAVHAGGGRRLPNKKAPRLST